VGKKGIPEADKWHSELDGKGTGVIDPLTGNEVTDQTLAIAIKEGTHYITKYRPRTVVQWSRFMKPRRTYRQIPKYTGISDEEAQVFQKIKHEAMVPITMIGAVWGKYGLKAVMEFIVAKQLPVYRWPNLKAGRTGYYVWCGDIVRAIKSCEIDLHADGDAWIKYMMRSYRNERIKRQRKEEKRAKSQAAAAGGGPDPGSTGGDGGHPPVVVVETAENRDAERADGENHDG